MSQTKQQEQDASLAQPGARWDWEPFWRIVAGLMLVVLAWAVWVMYQITPRSLVTPLAYATQVRPIGALEPASPVAAPAAAAAPPPATEPGAADLAMGIAQAGLRAGAHQASADVQAAALEAKQDQSKGEGLRLSTEISIPLAEKPGNPKSQEGKPGGAPAVPAAAGAGAKDRP